MTLIPRSSSSHRDFFLPTFKTLNPSFLGWLQTRGCGRSLPHPISPQCRDRSSMRHHAQIPDCCWALTQLPMRELMRAATGAEEEEEGTRTWTSKCLVDGSHGTAATRCLGGTKAYHPLGRPARRFDPHRRDPDMVAVDAQVPAVVG